MSREGNITEAEVHALVRKFEETHQAFSLTVDGVPLWQLIRFEVSVRRQRGGFPRMPLSRSRLVKGALRGLGQYLWPAGTYKYLCKTFDSAHRGEGTKGIVDIYFDSICDHTGGGAKISSYDATGFEDNVTAGARRPVFDDTSVIVLSGLLGRLLPFRRKHSVFDTLAQSISDEFGYSDYTSKRLARTYNVFRWRVVLYRLLLRKYAPQMVWSPDSGQFALMRACSDTGTCFAELQHGVFTSVHPNVLPASVPNEAYLITPSFLAVYGGFTREALHGTLLYAKSKIVPVGAPFIEQYRKMRDERFSASEKVAITVTTQGIATLQLCQLLADFLTMAGHNVMITIKLHPAYDTEEGLYRDFFAEDIRVNIVSGKSSMSTHELIALSDLHLSISSASHYDALGIGTPTGVISLDTYQSVDSILTHEGAFLVKDAEQLAQNVARRDWPAVSEKTREHFFSSGFLANVDRLMNSNQTQGRSFDMRSGEQS